MHPLRNPLLKDALVYLDRVIEVLHHCTLQAPVLACSPGYFGNPLGNPFRKDIFVLRPWRIDSSLLHLFLCLNSLGAPLLHSFTRGQPHHCDGLGGPLCETNLGVAFPQTHRSHGHRDHRLDVAATEPSRLGVQIARIACGWSLKPWLNQDDADVSELMPAQQTLAHAEKRTQPATEEPNHQQWSKTFNLTSEPLEQAHTKQYIEWKCL